MDDLNDMKALWLSADTGSLPAVEEIRTAASRFRNEKLRKTIALVCAALLLTLLEGVIWFIYPSKLASTHVGEICVILAGLILVGTNLNTLNRFYQNKDLSNKDFIAFLEKTQQRQLFFHQKTQVVAFILLAAGLLLYLLEPVRTDITALLITYTLAIAFLLTMWLVVRKRNYRKQNLKMSEMIKKMNDLSTQINQ